MNKELKMIETLKFSPVTDRKGSTESAKRIVKKYFAGDWGDKWELLTPTYRSNLRIGKEEWVKEAENFPTPQFKIRKVVIQSGCMAVVIGDLLFSELPRQIRIGLVRESGPYEPDPKAKYSVVGTTVPPFIAV